MPLLSLSKIPDSEYNMCTWSLPSWIVSLMQWGASNRWLKCQDWTGINTYSVDCAGAILTDECPLPHYWSSVKASDKYGMSLRKDSIRPPLYWENGESLSLSRSLLFTPVSHWPRFWFRLRLLSTTKAIITTSVEWLISSSLIFFSINVLLVGFATNRLNRGPRMAEVIC